MEKTLKIFINTKEFSNQEKIRDLDAKIKEIERLKIGEIKAGMLIYDDRNEKNYLKSYIVKNRNNMKNSTL